jgi:hypothetical protein
VKKLFALIVLIAVVFSAPAALANKKPKPAKPSGITLTDDQFAALLAILAPHVIANSSFSWWAAFISGNETIAPRLFFSETSGMPDQSHNILDHWEIR